MCHAVKASIRSGAYGESPRTAAEARAQLASHVPQHKQEGRETAEREESRGNSESAGEASREVAALRKRASEEEALHQHAMDELRQLAEAEQQERMLTYAGVC